MIDNTKPFVRYLVHWRIVKLRKKQRQILVPTKLSILLMLGLAYLLARSIWLHGNWRTFISEQNGFTVDYPAQWVKQGEYANGYKNLDNLTVDFYNVNALLIPTSGHVYIHHRIIQDGSLQDVAEWGLDLIETTGGAWSISPLEDDRVGTDRYSALVRFHRKRFRLTTFLIKNVYVIAGDDAYILQFSTAAHKWDESTEVFDQMLTSFQISD